MAFRAPRLGSFLICANRQKNIVGRAKQIKYIWLVNYKLSIVVCTLSIFFACQNGSEESSSPDADTTSMYDDEPIQDTIELFSGGRFRNVRVTKTGDSTFEVSGEAQVFEAAFSWVLEDDYRELKQGHQTTDSGAPAWGKFTFQLTAPRQSDNTNLQLILFEASAKDGSRQHELPIVLYGDH